MPLLRRALGVFAGTVPASQEPASQEPASQGPADQELRWLRLAGPAARHAWDDQAWDALTVRHLRLARDAGALSELPLALSRRVYLHLFSGELAAAASLTDELPAAVEHTGGDLISYAALGLAAVRGQDDEARALTEVIGQDAAARGEGIGVTAAKWASAVLGNGLGRYADALAAAAQASEHPDELGLAAWSQVELIEAAVRAGQPGRAADALRSLSEITSASGTDWALGVEARSRALRARRELMAAGQAPRKRTAEAAGELTAQERQIALRARTGRTNAEIGAELFLSPRTVEWHMSNVFMKLGITSRGQLWHALGGDAAIAVP